MSVSLGANGGTYQYPQENDPAGWGDDATDWASAVSAALSNIGLGASVSANAVVNIISTSKGILVPRMTTTQRNAIGSPSTSLLIYNTTTTQYELYTGSTWQSLASYISGTLTVTGAASLQSTLNVTGSSTFSNVTVTGNATLGDATADITAVTGILNVDSGVLYVDPTNNRVGINTTGPTTALTVGGASTLNGTLSVTGSSTLASSTINGTLSVTGNTTLASVTATGTILAASGSSGSPSVASSGDTDTGISWSAANQLDFQTGGSTRFRIESTGQIKAVYESQVGTDYNTTLDNGYFCRAWVNFNGTLTTLSGTYTISGTTITVSITSHGLSTGNFAQLDFASGDGVDGRYAVTVINANSYTITNPVSGSTGGSVRQDGMIRASGNVSSITKNGTGDYTVNFTTAMPDANYSVLAINRNSTTANSRGIGSITSQLNSSLRFESVYVSSTGGSGILTDDPIINVVIFR